MKQSNNFVFYYAVAITSILLIGSIFFFPTPFNIIQPIILTPMFLFFWLKITSPEEATEASWSGRLVLVIISLTGLGILGYYLASQTPEQKEDVAGVQIEDPSASVSAELAELREELADLKDLKEQIENTEEAETEEEQQGQLLDLLNSLGTPEPEESTVEDDTETTSTQRVLVGYVKVSGAQAVDIFEDKLDTAKITGVALPNARMPFYQSAGNWYEVEYEEGLFGWVKANQVTETN